MNKKVRKLLLSLVTTGMLAVAVAPVFVASANIQSDTERQKTQNMMIENHEDTKFSIDKEEKMVGVTLYSDENKTITVDIPETRVEEYTKKLENEEFRQQEIRNSSKSNSMFRAASSTVKYMGERDILEMVNHLDNSRNWLEFINNPIGSSALTAAIAILTKNNLMGVLGRVLAWGSLNLKNRQEKWWTQSAIMVLQGKINGVKLTITPSGKDYPKVYRTLERY